MPKTVLITGAARGIGRAIRELYEAKGWIVMAPARAELDCGISDQVRSWAENNCDKIDVLINNAGENPTGRLESMSLETWERCLRVNLTAPMLLANACSAGMRGRKWGRIVNISSIFGHLSREGRGPYATAKTGLLGFTRTAALEWGSAGVLVNALCPGYIETDLTRKNNSPSDIVHLAQGLPLQRLGRPDEVALAAYFLGSEDNSFITGQTLTIDGGFSVS